MTQQNEQYDIVISGGRVMDPETGLDAVRNVGVKDDRIAIITDNSTRENGSLASSGIPHVIVNGVSVVKDSKIVEGVYPGKPIRRPVTEV